MFTIKDICDIAIQIELNGETVYRQAAKCVNDLKIEDLFTQMADDERRHGQWFDDFSMEHAEKSGDQEMEAMGRSLLQEMMKDQTFSLEPSTLSKTEHMDALIRQCVAFEQDTITFYEMLLAFVDDMMVQQQLRTIIEEEREHVIRLKNLCQYSTA